MEPSPIVIVLRKEASLKASLPTEQPGAILKKVMPEFSNALFPINVISKSSSEMIRLEQFLNALSPIDVVKEPNSTLLREVQFSKALSGISSMKSGSEIDSNRVQSLKAEGDNS